ncbi:polysaccharide deacetylase family protein [Candidatus Bathyarchaeota archaeon]|nr:polysaccharide deacetylase family protein [Candidatus Bathyarchaeota archaeon]
MIDLLALSFDDGYLNHVKSAHLLSRLKVKGTFYIITHLKAWDKRPLLTTRPELITEIAELGHEIASHTCTHKDLRKLQLNDLIFELKASKAFLEDVTGKEVLGLAYPYGFYNSRVLNAVHRYYDYCRTTEFNLDCVMLMNSPPRSRYEIGAIPGLAIKGGFQKMLINAMKVKHRHIVLYTHVFQPVKLVTLVNMMKSLNVSFVTVSKLFHHLVKEYELK